MAISYTEGPRDGAFLTHEVSHFFRETGTLATDAAVYQPGTVLGLRGTGDTVTVTADAGNTGDGTLDAATVVTGKDVEHGAYVLSAKDANTFDVVTPSGDKLKDAKVGTAYSGTHLSGFSIAAGGTGFAAGDTLTVTVAAGDGKVVRLDPAADDGSQIAHAILYGRVDATASDERGVLVERLAVVADDRLVWPDGITSDQKAAAIKALAAKHLIIR